MKGYKKVSINESNRYYNQEDNNFISIIKKNISIIILILVILITLFSFLILYVTHQKKQIENKALFIKEIQSAVGPNLKKQTKMPKNLTEEIQNYEKTLRSITKEEIQDFRNINNLGILFDKTKYKRSESPDITVVTTMRNQAHCVLKAIRSVQNQSLKNVEMIIIDDCSLDNSTEVVEELMKEDERIIFVKHDDNNEGIMISRNEAIRMAKGKYITVLDPDDTFLHKDILKYSLHVAEMADLDVVEFYSSYYNNNKFIGNYHYHGNFPIIYQPELRTKFFNIRENVSKFRPIKCRTVWGKIVKNEIFQKTLNNIPEKYLYDYILGFEDTMITLSLYEVAQSYYCLRQPGYYYTFDERKNKFPLSKNKTCKVKKGVIKNLDHLKYIQYLVDKLRDNEFEKQVLYNEIKVVNEYDYSNFKKTIKSHFNWAYSIFDGLINSKYIKPHQKELLQKIKDEIKENENNLKKEK
jgi:glycosyltransferase involved in cell wall biosynthesis